MKSSRPPLPEVEPLGDARWNRIEREIFAELDAGAHPVAPATVTTVPRRSLLAAGGIAAAAAVAAFFGAKALAPTHQQAPLSHVETGAGESMLTLGEATVRVERDSGLLVGGDAKSGVLLVLDRGAVTCDVAPRAGRPAFVVQAGNVRVRVVGTRFRVGRVGAGASVHVDHGMVEVTAQGVPRMLRDGETFSTEPVASVSVSASAPPPESAPAPIASFEATEPRRPRAVPSAPREGGIIRTPIDFDAAPPASPREEYERAARLERTDPSAAASAYRKLAAGTGPWSANALFALARLEASRGRSAEARRLAEEYLARFPKGANATDARELVAKTR